MLLISFLFRFLSFPILIYSFEKVLDGKIHPHPGPEVTQYNWLSRLTFWPATRLTCTCGKRKSHSKRGPGATAGSVDHNELWRMKGAEAHSVWKTFKPYWQEEVKQKEFEIFCSLDFLSCILSVLTVVCCSV
jgi:hypothetical protein